MLKYILKFFSFWIIINISLFPQVKDTITVFEYCGSCFRNNVDRVVVCSVLKIDSLVIENKELFNVLPQPSRSYKNILSSINYGKIFLFLPIYRGSLTLKLSIDTTGRVEILKTHAHNFVSSIYEDSIVKAFKKEKFSPAKTGNNFLSSVLNIYLSSRLVLEKYKKDENTFERVIDLFKGNDIKIIPNKKFIVETLEPEEKWKRLAEKDIANGKCYLLSFGYKVNFINDTKERMLTQKYGFEFKDMGCDVPYGAGAYNEEMMKYLTKKNGEGWYERFLSEYKALNK